MLVPTSNWRCSGTWPDIPGVKAHKVQHRESFPAGTHRNLTIMKRTNENESRERMKRTNEAFSDTGKGNAAAAVVPSQLYLANSWGGACARGAVGGGRQIASRTIRTRIDLGRRGREDFFAAGRPQWCVPCLVLDGRPGAQCDVLLPGWPTAGYNFRGNGWERDMLFIWVVRESEGRRKLRTAARSPASTMSCGRRTGVGEWECE